MSGASLSTHRPLQGSLQSRPRFMDDLQTLSRLPTELALQRAARYLARLVEDPAFFEAEIVLSSKDWRHKSRLVRGQRVRRR